MSRHLCAAPRALRPAAPPLAAAAPGALRLALAALAAAAALATACANHPDLGLPSVAPVSAGPRSLNTDVQPIFSASCATTSGCHLTSDPSSGSLDLSQGHSYISLVGPNTVGVPSTEDAAFLRVKPGDSANSYLVLKLKGTATIGLQMPYPTPLDASAIKAITDWIDQGAQNN